MGDVYTPGGAYSSGPVDETKCRARIWNGVPIYRSSQCNRKAIDYEGGYGWCKQHAPSAVKARDDAQRAKRKAQSDRTDYQNKTRQLEQAILNAALVWAPGYRDSERALLVACNALLDHRAESQP